MGKGQRRQARAATGCGPVTVTNSRTGSTNRWQPYTANQLRAMDGRAVRRPRRVRVTTAQPRLGKVDRAVLAYWRRHGGP